MAHTRNGSTRLYYETAGDGVVSGTDTVTFLADVGYGPWQWAWQHPSITGPYRTVVPTTRGCGRSDTSASWDFPTLLDDLVAVLRDAGVGRTHLVASGLSGLVALAAARRIDRVDRLALLAPPRRAEQFDHEAMLADPTDEAALQSSLTAVLTDEFRDAHPETIERIVEWRANEDAPPAVWRTHVNAIADWSLDPLYEITTETLVLHGTADRVCPPDAGRELADDLPRGEFHAVPDAGHLLGCEAARPVTDRLLAFFGEPDTD